MKVGRGEQAPVCRRMVRLCMCVCACPFVCVCVCSFVCVWVGVHVVHEHEGTMTWCCPVIYYMTYGHTPHERVHSATSRCNELTSVRKLDDRDPPGYPCHIRR